MAFLRLPATRSGQVGLGVMAVAALLIALSIGLGQRGDDRLVFSYATYHPRFWDGDCVCPAPVATDDLLVFCGGNGWKEQTRLVAVDRRTKQDVWRQLRPTGCGALRVIGGVIALWDGRELSAFNTGGSTLWTRGDVVGLPFEVDGRVVLSAGTRSALLVVDPRNGTSVDEIPIPERPDGTPLVDGNTITYGTRSGRLVSLNLVDRTSTVATVASRILSPLVRHGSLLVFNAEVAGGFSLIAYDVARAEVRWSVDTRTLSQATPLIDGEWVYYGADRLYAVRLATGAARTYALAEGPVGTPVIHDGIMYVAGGRFLHALDPATGVVRWRFAADEWINAPATTGPPVLRDNVLYFGSLDCRVYGIRAGP